MPTFKSEKYGQNIMAPHSAGEVMVMDDVVSLPNTLAANDLALMGFLPLDCVPVECMVYTDELDTHGTDTLRFSVGLLNDAGTGLVAGTAMISGAQAEVEKVIRGNGVGLAGIAPDKTKDRTVAVLVTAAGATKAAGKLRVRMFYRAA